MPEYNFQTFKQMNLWCMQCMSHRICRYISNKQMCNSHTELDFVFYNKTVREHLKKY